MDPEKEEIIHGLTIQDIVRWFDYHYPKDVFKNHPISWVRRIMKWLSGADALVMVEEEKYNMEVVWDERGRGGG